jgi:signal transduction histidine kinase
VGVAVDLYRATHRGKVQVQTFLEPTAPIEMDRLQIQQVVLNLLENAGEAMPGGGLALVATRGVNGGAELVVEDSGTGIPRESLPRIFDPFFSTKQDGTGLGLAIVRRIVEAHGGSISVHSQVGRGTSIRVFLPATERLPSAPA